MPILEKSTHSRGVECENPSKHPAAFSEFFKAAGKCALILFVSLLLFADIFSLLLCLLLHTSFGWDGFAYARVLATLSTVLFSLWMTRRLFSKKPYKRPALFLISATGILVLLLVIFNIV